MRRWREVGALALLLAAAPAGGAAAGEDAAGLYRTHCAVCHGADRLGGMGPALFPEALARLKPAAAARVIAEGRSQTQMPAFAQTLGPDEIADVAAFVYAPLALTPVWGTAEIAASRVQLRDPAAPAGGPVHAADPLNLFVVVEAGDSHMTVLDGDRLEPLGRYPTRFALHGGPKFSPDGRFVFLGSRDGWVSKFDLYALETVAEVRAGINLRNIAISGDGETLAVANYVPPSLVLLDARDLAPIRVIAAADRAGTTPSRVSAVYQAMPRQSFVVALKDIPELWEVSWRTDPPPVFAGLVHSHEEGMVEGLAERGRFPIRRIALSQPLDDFSFDPRYRNLLGSARDGGKAVVVNLDVGREIATIAMPGLPHLGSAIAWMRGGHPVMATPDLRDGVVSVIDMASWRLERRIPTLGPGFFLRSHEAIRHAWVDNAYSAHRDTLQLIDKETLEVAATLTPAPGQTASHVEFSRDGRYALVSIAEDQGALVIYDTATLTEAKRLPMRKPSGKYNVYNKIMLSTGTSH